MRRFWIYLSVLIAGALGVAGVVFYDYHQRERQFFERTACVGSLERIKLAKAVYADDHHLTNGVLIPDGVLWPAYGSTERCLSGGHYSVNPVGISPSCSYTGIVRWGGRLWSHELPKLNGGLTRGLSQ